MNTDKTGCVRPRIESRDEHFIPGIDQPDRAFIRTDLLKRLEEQGTHSRVEDDIKTRIAGLHRGSSQTRKQSRTETGEILVRKDWEATLAHGFTLYPGRA